MFWDSVFYVCDENNFNQTGFDTNLYGALHNNPQNKENIKGLKEPVEGGSTGSS